MRAFLARLFAKPVPPTTRLSPAEAQAIGMRAAFGAGHEGTFGHAVPVWTEGVRRWNVCQSSIGSGWRVEVDDATGDAVAVTR